MTNNEIQQNIMLVLSGASISSDKAALVKEAVVERLRTLQAKPVIGDNVCNSLVEQSTQSRENESAIARKTHYHLKGVERAVRELIEVIKKNNV